MLLFYSPTVTIGCDLYFWRYFWQDFVLTSSSSESRTALTCAVGIARLHWNRYSLGLKVKICRFEFACSRLQWSFATLTVGWFAFLKCILQEKNVVPRTRSHTESTWWNRQWIPITRKSLFSDTAGIPFSKNSKPLCRANLDGLVVRMLLISKAVWEWIHPNERGECVSASATLPCHGPVTWDKVGLQSLYDL